MVTTLYAGILGLIYVGLSAYVIKGRFQYRVSLGDGGQEALTRRIRAHGNFIEYVPFAVILIILAEFEGISEMTIHGLGGFLVLGRFMHIMGVVYPQTSFICRRGGMVITFGVIVLSSILCVKSFFIF